MGMAPTRAAYRIPSLFPLSNEQYCFPQAPHLSLPLPPPPLSLSFFLSLSLLPSFYGGGGGGGSCGVWGGSFPPFPPDETLPATCDVHVAILDRAQVVANSA